MTAPEDFEQRLADRMERAGEALTGDGVTLGGIAARHRERARARRARQGAAVAVAAGVLAVVGVGVAADDDGPGRVVTQGPVASQAAPPETEVCVDETAVVVYLRPTASDEATQVVGRALEERFGAEAVHFVSQDEAYEQARELFADDPAMRDSLRPVDVPASFRVLVAGSGLELAELRGEVEELVTGMEVYTVEVVAERAVDTTVPAGDPATTTTMDVGGGILTEEQVRYLVAYVRSLQLDGTSLGAGEPWHAGCGDSGAETTSPPTTDATPSPAGPAGEDPPSTSAPGPDPVPDPEPDTTPPPTTTPAWPAVATPQHGGRIWAVYLAVVPDAEGPAAPDLRRAGDQARDLDYDPGTSDLACDRGAAEALGLDPAGTYLGLSLYFGAEDEARLFAEMFAADGRGEVRGVVEVTTYCLD